MICIKVIWLYDMLFSQDDLYPHFIFQMQRTCIRFGEQNTC